MKNTILVMCLVAAFADEVLKGGGMRALAWSMSAFWTWSLLRQLSVLRGLVPARWHAVLCAIFVCQGPLFAVVLASEFTTLPVCRSSVSLSHGAN